jgi:hypothetical protein
MGAGGTAALANDINGAGYSNTGNVFSGTFTGTFLGLGNTISNLTISRTAATSGTWDGTGTFQRKGQCVGAVGVK